MTGIDAQSPRDPDAPTFGILYIVFGEAYAREARQSIASLREVCPTLSVAVVTDSCWTDGPLPDVFILRESQPGWRCKPRFMYEATPFEWTLFVDADTVFARDIANAFGLLRHYDLAVRFTPHQQPVGATYFHPGCNSGVMLFRRGPAVERLFVRWLEEYDRLSASPRVAADVRGLGDQEVLMAVLPESSVRPIHLPDYMNFTLWEPVLTNAPPAILAGRHEHMRQIARRSARRWDHTRDYAPKIWLPAIGGFLPTGGRQTHDPLLKVAYILRRLANWARNAIDHWRSLRRKHG